MFEDPIGEDRVCMRVRTLVEEFGPENVIIYVPSKWKNYAGTSLGRCELRFLDANVIRLQAYNGDKIAVQIDEELVFT